MVALGDVSGKGIPAALFMGITMTLLRSMARLSASPDEILRRVNDELARAEPAGHVRDAAVPGRRPGTMQVSCAGAGHDSAVLLSPGKPPRLVIPPTGRVVGLMPEIR